MLELAMNRSNKILLVGIFFQFLFILFVSYSLVFWPPSLMSLLPITWAALGYPIIGLISLYLLWRHRKHATPVLSFIFLLSSLSLATLAPAFFLTTRLVIYLTSNRFGPDTPPEPPISISKQKQTLDYRELSRLLNQPQTVIDFQDNLLLLESGIVIKLNTINSSAPIVGQKVTVKLLSTELFNQAYTGHSGIFYNRKNTDFYDIPAAVYLEGKLFGSY